MQDVLIMTHSFGDELFGSLFDEFGKSGFYKNIILKNFNEEQKAILRVIIQSHIENTDYLYQRLMRLDLTTLHLDLYSTTHFLPKLPTDIFGDIQSRHRHDIR